MFAEIMLVPGGMLAWLFVGLIAGWLTGLFMQGTGYGMLMDIVIGLIGAFVGGLICSIFIEGAAGFWGSIGVAFVGGCLLVALIRMIVPRPSV